MARRPPALYFAIECPIVRVCWILRGFFEIDFYNKNVTPAKAGAQHNAWIPASAGMTFPAISNFRAPLKHPLRYQNQKYSTISPVLQLGKGEWIYDQFY